VWPVPLAQVLSCPQLIFPSKSWLFGISFNFHKSLKNQYLPHSESKSYQINSIKFYSSRSFRQHQSHIPILPKISATIKFNFQRRNHLIFKNFCTAKSKCHGTKAHAPSSLRAFQRHQEHDLKHPSLVDLITTKQNKTNYLPW
jgi:hypothetical protein